MRAIFNLIFVITMLFITGCVKNTQSDFVTEKVTIDQLVDPYSKVLKEDKRGIKTRQDAVQFYINKGVSLYFDNQMKLTSFDCSRPGGLTDDDMKYIVFFPEAGAVHLSDEGLTDEIFFYFQNLKKITALGLYNTSVTGEGFRFLLDKKELIIFDFGGSPVTDKGLAYLSQINYSDNLVILNLKNSRVTDEGMKFIKLMKVGKCRINLRNTLVTDDGIKLLAGFKDIVEVDLLYTKVTDSGGKWLKNQLPRANITWGEIPPQW